MASKAECRNVIIFLLCLLKIGNIRAQCSRPNIVDNRILTPESDKSSFPDGSTATFTCSTGYVTVDPRASKSITCNGNTWTDLALQCKKRSCGALPEVANGRHSYSPDGDEGLLFGATATVKCNTGYILVGQPARRCLNSGWDGRDPVCEEVKCLPPPANIENGETTEPLEDVYPYQAVVSYTCNEGFFMSGKASVACLDNGTFSTPPQCKKNLCGELDFVPNSQKTGAKPPYKLGNFVQFHCDKGYRAEGSLYLRCELSGWSSSLPRCIELKNEPHPTSPPQPNRGLQVGLGVGITVIVVALCVAVYVCKKRSFMDNSVSPPKP